VGDDDRTGLRPDTLIGKAKYYKFEVPKNQIWYVGGGESIDESKDNGAIEPQPGEHGVREFSEGEYIIIVL